MNYYIGFYITIVAFDVPTLIRVAYNKRVGYEITFEFFSLI